MRSFTPQRAALAAAGAALALLVACATNPVTGDKELMLFSESQEIEMGRAADEDVVRSFGIYDDEDLNAYVDRLGQELAAKSERPDLPWTFRVVDDASVNAFALPGGFIYLTRGILSHLNSEAELVGVLGHEIGHVTARHGMSRLSKAQLASVGLGVGMVLSPEFRQFGDLAQTSVGLLFLKYGRDDERQADDLGFRYMTASGYPPEALTDVFDVLGRLSQASEQGRLPNWLSTHPAPENRSGRVASRLDEVPADVARASEREAQYLAKVENMIFGPDPRQGYFEGSHFYHPDLKFQMQFPEGWTTRNERSAVYAVSPKQDAIVVLSLVQEPDAGAAERAFFNQQGVEAGRAWLNQRAGVDASRLFRASDGRTTLIGGVAFEEYGGNVYRLLGYTREQDWRRYDDALASTVASFERLTDRRKIDVDPMRVKVVTVPRAMTLEEFDRRYPSSIELERLALINHLDPGERIEAGRKMKRVVGFNPDRKAG